MEATGHERKQLVERRNVENGQRGGEAIRGKTAKRQGEATKGRKSGEAGHASKRETGRRRGKRAGSPRNRKNGQSTEGEQDGVFDGKRPRAAEAPESG